MAKKSASSDVFKFNGYANIPIPAMLADSCEDFIKDGNAVLEQMNLVISEGYSLKVYYDVKEDTYRASLTCMTKDDANYGYVMSGYANDGFKAIGVVLFKHVEVAKHNWQGYSQGSKNTFG